MDFTDFDYRYTKTKTVNLTVEEFNNKLDELEKLDYEIAMRFYADFLRIMRCNDGSSGSTAYVYTEDKCCYHLYYQDVDIKTFKIKPHHFKCNIYLQEDKEEDVKMFLGRKAIMELKKYSKEFDEDIEFKENMHYDRDDIKCRVYLPTNSKIKRNKWIEHCYGYDMHSCYPSFINNPLPYGNIIREDSIVYKGEIGFRFERSFECTYIIMCLENEYADIIFKSKYYQGMIKWANEQYELKRSGKLDKRVFNAMLGNMKHHNIFIRTAVLEYAYKCMESLYDPETTILSTIDSIVSLKPRTDLNIGKDMGQFEEEHTDEPFIFESNGKKQWLTGEVIWKGKNKAKIKDNKYIQLNPNYYWDYDTRRFVISDMDKALTDIWPEYIGDYNKGE